MKNHIVLTLRSAVAAVALSSVVIVTNGCTKQTTLQVVTSINQHIPEVVAGAQTAAATIAALLPADAAIVGVADTAFTTAANTLQALTATYIANPSATVLQQIQTTIATLEGQINTATLNAEGIKDAKLQQLVIAALKGLLTIVTVVFALILPTMTPAQVGQLREQHQIQLARARQYMDQQRLQTDLPGVDLDRAFAVASSQGL